MIIFNKAECPNCGAKLTLHRKKSTAVCSYCGSEFIVEETNDAHLILNNSKKQDTKSSKSISLPSVTSNCSSGIGILIIGIIIILVGSILLGVSYKGYEMQLENNEVLCSNIKTCNKTFGNIKYKFKIDSSNVTVCNQFTLKIEDNDTTYYTEINRVLERDGYIYLNEAPIYAYDSTTYYYASFQLINKSQVVSGIILLIIGAVICAFYYFILRG